MRIPSHLNFLMKLRIDIKFINKDINYTSISISLINYMVTFNKEVHSIITNNKEVALHINWFTSSIRLIFKLNLRSYIWRPIQGRVKSPEFNLKFEKSHIFKKSFFLNGTSIKPFYCLKKYLIFGVSVSTLINLYLFQNNFLHLNAVCIKDLWRQINKMWWVISS